jgi:hypothetical protein
MENFGVILLLGPSNPHRTLRGKKKNVYSSAVGAPTASIRIRLRLYAADCRDGPKKLSESTKGGRAHQLRYGLPLTKAAGARGAYNPYRGGRIAARYRTEFVIGPSVVADHNT